MDALGYQGRLLLLKSYVLFTVPTRHSGNLSSKDLVFLDSFTLYIVLI